MPSIYKLTKDMEVKLHALLTELQDLKNKVQELEEENARLRQSLTDACRERGIIENEGDGKQGTGFLNLLELYDRGFHICNVYFGRSRATECLFCMALLKKGHEPAIDQLEG